MSSYKAPSEEDILTTNRKFDDIGFVALSDLRKIKILKKSCIKITESEKGM